MRTVEFNCELTMGQEVRVVARVGESTAELESVMGRSGAWENVEMIDLIGSADIEHLQYWADQESYALRALA